MNSLKWGLVHCVGSKDSFVFSVRKEGYLILSTESSSKKNSDDPFLFDALLFL